MSFGQLLMAAGGPLITLSATSFSAGPGGANFVVFEFRSDGSIWRDTDAAAGGAQIGTWITPQGVAPGAYEIRFSHVSGDATNTGSALDTWHALTSNRSRGWTTPPKSGTYLAEIRLGSTVLASANFSGTFIAP
jgi:hypothetical protein